MVAIRSGAGKTAKLPFSVHSHTVRHTCGYKRPNDDKDTRAVQLYMGHRNIRNIVGYTQLSAERFKDFGSIEFFRGDTSARSGQLQ